MSNLTEISNFDTGIYQLEITDPVEGGPGGIANAQAQALANRTRWLKNNLSLALPGDVKEIDVATAYIAANFDATGLGKVGFEREGWAICNGNNGTRNRKGRVSIGYDSVNFTTLGATGGEQFHLLTETEMAPHDHFMFVNTTGTVPAGPSSDHLAKQRDVGGTGDKYAYGVVEGSGNPTVGKTGKTGGSTVIAGAEPHNNMQPYIVTLFIQKL